MTKRRNKAKMGKMDCKHSASKAFTMLQVISQLKISQERVVLDQFIWLVLHTFLSHKFYSFFYFFIFLFLCFDLQHLLKVLRDQELDSLSQKLEKKLRKFPLFAADLFVQRGRELELFSSFQLYVRNESKMRQEFWFVWPAREVSHLNLWLAVCLTCMVRRTSVLSKIGQSVLSLLVHVSRKLLKYPSLKQLITRLTN